MALHDVSATTADGVVLGMDNVEFNFDAENKVIYLYSERGVSYVNFNQLIQFGATPPRRVRYERVYQLRADCQSDRRVSR